MTRTASSPLPCASGSPRSSRSRRRPRPPTGPTSSDRSVGQARSDHRLRPGIGRAIGLRYAARGADIVINYARGEVAVEQTRTAAAALGVRAVAVRTDVAIVDEVRQLFATMRRPDIVVVNAGLEHSGLPVTEFTEEQFDRMFAVNTKGAFFTMQEAARHVADRGRIIYVSSSTTGYPMPGYAPARRQQGSAGVPGSSPRPRGGSSGVTVNAILPSATQGAGLHTDAGPDAPIRAFLHDFNPMGRMGTADDVAEFFAGPLSSFVSGQSLTVAGGALA
ncbi:SDR family oxidoreductase [Actinoplanes sp. NPDC020271]|uniref:SDR family oxidoreductase n=1 Tax=Actinoplanes sp. NPDC020271 TaxID=3363896 RepID=UPI0037902A76